MEIERGTIIDQACDIVRKTYSEINRLKNDIGNLLSDYGTSYDEFDQYSYSSNSLHLKANHAFLLRLPSEETNDHVLGIVCIFFDDGTVNRISLKDQPELWVGLVDAANHEKKLRAADVRYMLSLKDRKYFKGGELRIGGDVFEYYWTEAETEEKKQECKGRFVGYPLADITNIEVLKEKVMDRLFKSKSETA